MTAAAQPPFSQRFEILNQRDQIDGAQQSLLGAVEARGYDDSSRFAIRLALEEALSNAFKHGNANDPTKPVEVSCRVDDDVVEIEIADRGPGFELGAVPDPTQEENLEIPSGRGIVLMRSFMARVEFVPPGNRVRMVYERPRGE